MQPDERQYGVGVDLAMLASPVNQLLYVLDRLLYLCELQFPHL